MTILANELAIEITRCGLLAYGRATRQNRCCVLNAKVQHTSRELVLIPYNTDAPLYHWPYATAGMIVANVIAFLGVNSLVASMSEEQAISLYENLILLYGQGLLPWQWVTSNFMHAGWMHLLGNMFCLWGFGIIVEGKVGWKWFVLIYFGIGITECAIEQTLMLFASEGASLGASSIIYGLMAIALVWAPRNEMNCLFFLFWVFTFDVSVAMLAGISLLIEILTGLVSGLNWGSQVLHLFGAAIGIGVAVVMLKRNLVDCEGWDIFSTGDNREVSRTEQVESDANEILNGFYKRRTGGATTQQPTPAAIPQYVPTPLPGEVMHQTTALPTRQLPAELEQIRQAIMADAPERALAIHRKQLAERPGWKLPERELLALINGLQNKKLWSESIPMMIDYLRDYYQQATQVRLKLAQILMVVSKRPDQALRVLEPLNPGLISPQESQRLSQLRAPAQQQLARS